MSGDGEMSSQNDDKTNEVQEKFFEEEQQQEEHLTEQLSSSSPRSESAMNIITQSSIAMRLLSLTEKRMSFAIEKQNEMDQQNAAMRVAIRNLEQHVDHSRTRFDISRSKFERLQQSTDDNLKNCDLQKVSF